MLSFTTLTLAREGTYLVWILNRDRSEKRSAAMFWSAIFLEVQLYTTSVYFYFVRQTIREKRK